jgi:hypothetical protein
LAQPSEHPVPYPSESSQEGPMDIASVFEWFAQESISIAEQAAEPEQREKLAELALLWASVATVQRRSTGDAIYSSIQLVGRHGRPGLDVC